MRKKERFVLGKRTFRSQKSKHFVLRIIQALEMNPMTMKDWIEALDNQIIAHKRKVLIDKGRISHKQAIEKAEKEFAIYRKREMDLLESDFDKEIKRLKDKNDNNPN